MRIVILTQYFPPETGAPQNRLSDLARRLSGLGHQVRILTAMPNYPEGRIQEGYRDRFILEEDLDGVPVLRSWIFATRSRGLVRWAWHYFSFVLSSLVAGAFRLPRADVIFTESPPLFLGITGLILAKLKGARFVLNVADLWPKAGVDLGIVRNPLQIRVLEGLEGFLYRRASLVTGQTEGIVAHVAERTGSPVRLLPNGADTGRFRPDGGDPELRSELGLGDRFVIGYGGLHGPAQALHTVVEAAARLRDDPRILFALFGDGPEKERLRVRATEMGLDNVRFFPVQPQCRMPGLVPLWDAGVVTLYDGELMRLARPSKLFEMMSCGLPILLSAPKGESSKLLDEAQGGLHVPPEDPAALAEAARRLAVEADLVAELGANARRFIERRFDRQVIAEELARDLTERSVARGRAGWKSR